MTSQFKCFIKWAVLYPLLFLSALFLVKCFSSNGSCVVDRETRLARFHMGGYALDIPSKYLSLCGNQKAQLAMMDLTWPEFERVPYSAFSKSRHDELMRKRLLIGLVEKEFRNPEDIKTWHEKSLERMLNQKNRSNKKLIFSQTPEPSSNGMMKYVPVNREDVHLTHNIYTLRDGDGKLQILLTCKMRAVGGAYCRNDYQTYFGSMEVSYSFDISHLKDAIEIDTKVKEFIESMIVNRGQSPASEASP